ETKVAELEAKSLLETQRSRTESARDKQKIEVLESAIEEIKTTRAREVALQTEANSGLEEEIKQKDSRIEQLEAEAREAEVLYQQKLAELKARTEQLEQARIAMSEELVETRNKSQVETRTLVEENTALKAENETLKRAGETVLAPGVVKTETVEPGAEDPVTKLETPEVKAETPVAKPETPETRSENLKAEPVAVDPAPQTDSKPAADRPRRARVLTEAVTLEKTAEVQANGNGTFVVSEGQSTNFDGKAEVASERVSANDIESLKLEITRLETSKIEAERVQARNLATVVRILENSSSPKVQEAAHKYIARQIAERTSERTAETHGEARVSGALGGAQASFGKGVGMGIIVSATLAFYVESQRGLHSYDDYDPAANVSGK
ncbi:MAG: hypothetical protein K8F91_23895, partial [Candidatus Obscuribacterales bacterium]|nr:hypothetical protein [Candidatus Obscuribacterales bacterium]